jgi:hypothetical protein
MADTSDSDIVSPIKGREPKRSNNDDVNVTPKKRRSRAAESETEARTPGSASKVARTPSSSRARRSSATGMFGNSGMKANQPANDSDTTDKSSRKGSGRQARRSARLQKAASRREDGSPQPRKERRLTRGAVRSRSIAPATGTPIQPSSKIRESDEFGDAETSGDQGIQSTPIAKGRGRSKAHPMDDFIVPDEDEDVFITSGRRSRKQAAKTKFESSGDEKVESSMVKAKPNRRKQHSRQNSKQEIEDSNEDLEFFGAPIKYKDTVSDKRKAMGAALELLKRRRRASTASASQAAGQPSNGQPTDTVAESRSATISEEPSAINTVESDDDAEKNLSDIEVTAREMFQQDEDDEDFIVDEEEDNLGVPSELPLAITFGRYKAKQLFKFAVEWMVQKKINPAFAINDEVYRLTFMKLGDQIRGLAGSKYTSAAWTVQFTRALNARPIIEIQETPSSLEMQRDKCDACNRRGHPAKFMIKFSGKPYHDETLEEVSDDDSSEDLSETQELDSAGQEILSSDTTFYIGR